jgi:hypothetical protein
VSANYSSRTNDSRMVTVCASCLMACCWQGEFYCDDYRRAGTVEKSVSELLDLGREHPSYWRAER